MGIRCPNRLLDPEDASQWAEPVSASQRGLTPVPADIYQQGTGPERCHDPHGPPPSRYGGRRGHPPRGAEGPHHPRDPDCRRWRWHGGPLPAPERTEPEEPSSKEQSPETKPNLPIKKNWYKGKKKSKGGQTTANPNKAVPQPKPKQKTPHTNNTKGK